MTHPLLKSEDRCNKFPDLIRDALVYQSKSDKPTGSIRFKKRHGCKRIEAFKVSGTSILAEATGTYVRKENPSGSKKFYAVNGNGYILQDIDSYHNFCIGNALKPYTLRTRRNLSGSEIPTSYMRWKDGGGHCYDLKFVRVWLDSSNKEWSTEN